MPFLSSLRYIVFAAFIVCNAILASVAVWNASLNPASPRDTGIDIYITVLGAVGLFSTFSIIFIELIRRNAVTSRVWFEITWTALFFTMDLAAAAALTSVGPSDMCEHHKGVDPPMAGSCASIRVLMGFVWLCTFILLIYLVLLLLLSYINRNNESVPKIWECAIHNFPPLTMPSRPRLDSMPIIPRFTRNESRNEMAEVPVVAAPAPRRPTAPPALYSHRSIGLNSQYQIEHFHPPPDDPGHPSVPTPASPVASPANHLHRKPSAPGTTQAAMALYPRFISSAYVPPSPPARRPTVPRDDHEPPSGSDANAHPHPLPPPPLGDWPRPDAPLRVKRMRPMPVPPVVPRDGAASSRPLGPRAARTGPRPSLDLVNNVAREDH